MAAKSDCVSYLLARVTSTTTDAFWSNAPANQIDSQRSEIHFITASGKLKRKFKVFSLRRMHVLAGECSHTLSALAITNDQCSLQCSQVDSVNVITYCDSLSSSCSWVPVRVEPPAVVAIERLLLCFMTKKSNTLTSEKQFINLNVQRETMGLIDTASH